jgi:hypothetical protein
MRTAARGRQRDTDPSAGTELANSGHVPRISEFYGIVIAMYYADHAPPHFHARYGEREALIGIDPLLLLRGSLPPRALALVLEWAGIHRLELEVDWLRAARGLPLASIPPLQ